MDTDLSFSERELALIRRVAQERGITEEEAANQLMHEAISQRFRRHLGKTPAQVYPLKRIK